jgi:hypothetical protein
VQRASFSLVISSSQSTCYAVHGSELSQQRKRYWACYTNIQSKEACMYSLPWTFTSVLLLHYICSTYALLRRIFFSMKSHIRAQIQNHRVTWHVYKSRVTCTVYSRGQWTRAKIQHALNIRFFFNGTNPMVHIASTMYSICTASGLLNLFPDHCRNNSAIQKIQLILWSEEIILVSWDPTISCKPVYFTSRLMITQEITTSA